jgi:hypothetical protein
MSGEGKRRLKMHIMISFATGHRVEGILLAASDSFMRVVVPSGRETMELRRVAGCWESEEGEPIEIESIVTSIGVEAPAPRTFAAGHYC